MTSHLLDIECWFMGRSRLHEETKLAMSGMSYDIGWHNGVSVYPASIVSMQGAFGNCLFPV